MVFFESLDGSEDYPYRITQLQGVGCFLIRPRFATKIPVSRHRLRFRDKKLRFRDKTARAASHRA